MNGTIGASIDPFGLLSLYRGLCSARSDFSAEALAASKDVPSAIVVFVCV